jgi:hypothetical protein
MQDTIEAAVSLSDWRTDPNRLLKSQQLTQFEALVGTAEDFYRDKDVPPQNATN